MPWTEYNYSNITGFFDTVEYANELTSGYFGLSVVVGFWFVNFIAFMRYGTSRAFAASSFMSFVLSVIMRSGEMVGDYVPVILALMTMFSVMMTYDSS